MIRTTKFRGSLGRTFWIFWITLAAWVWLLASPAYAAGAQDECFCLAHPSGAMLRGCMAYQARTDFYSTAVCTDPETGKTAEQLITGEWQRLNAGEDKCNPCRRLARGVTDEVPRGDDKKSGAVPPQIPKPENQEPAK